MQPTPGPAVQVSWAELDGPIGRMYVAWGPAGFVLVEPAGDASGFELDLMLRTGSQARRVKRVPGRLASPIARQLAGEWQPDLPLDLSRLTTFAADTLRITMHIPWGEVRPYAWVAREVGRPHAVRAVGTALGHNPLPFLVPCHRVVRADGRVGEYGAGGPAAKVRMLRTEGLDPDVLEALADDGVRYLGEERTMVYCFPTCRRVRGSGAHQVPFRDGRDAEAAGYRACPECRPLRGPVFRT